MNGKINKGLKALNIRDYADSPRHRKAMGFFKHQAYENGISQAEMLAIMVDKFYKIKPILVNGDENAKID